MKKIVSVLLACVLIACTFVGCSKADNNNNNGEEFELKLTLDSHYSTYDESAVRAYEKLCLAVEAYDPSVKFNYAMLDKVNQLFFTCNPLYPLVSEIKLSADKSGVEIAYANDEETHKGIISQFKQKISEIMTECGNGKVDIDEYIFNAYAYIAQNMQIDSSVYNALETTLQSKGVKSAVNSLFEYLVLQAGGSVCHAVNTDGEAVMLATVKFNGEWYFFDPATEAQNNSGNALTRFAMNDKTVNELYNVKSFTYTDGQKLEPIKSDEYSSLVNSVEYTKENTIVTVILSNQKKFTIDL